MKEDKQFVEMETEYFGSGIHITFDSVVVSSKVKECNKRKKICFEVGKILKAYDDIKLEGGVA